VPAAIVEQKHSRRRELYNPCVTLLDLIAVAWIAFSCFQGARRGLVANALSLVGFAAGAVIGSRLAPHLLAAGAASPWLPAATMVTALVLGLAAQALAGTAAGQIRHHWLRGPLETVDTAGGLAVGAIFGLALVWLAAVVAVQQPMLGLRSDVQRSEILPALLNAVPASSVLSALAQFDPLPVIPSLADRSLPPPTPGAVPATGAKQSVFKVEGEACGLVVQGSGWAISPHMIVTNAHVVAGERYTSVRWHGDQFRVPGEVVAISADNDIALIRVRGVSLHPLKLAGQDADGGNVALVGYPENGGLTVNAGRAGASVTVITPDAYGNHVHARTVVPLRGLLRHGDSGGPVINAAGNVVAMMFAADSQGHGGFGVPTEAIRALAEDVSPRPVSTGPCIN
jgi:S1-C subfamily serine protease